MVRENIYLIGLMGAGKTTIGKVLAKQFDMQFYDSDVEIEKRTGVKIPTIFELEGEAGFRKRETAAIQALTGLQNIVLATGGGAVLAEENRKFLQQSGRIIYLRANVNDLWQRTRHDKQRPLLQNVDVRAKLQQLYEERHGIYTALANDIVDTGNQPASSVIHQIEQLLA